MENTSHHILLYLTITLYVYINATLVRHDLSMMNEYI